MNWKKGPQGLFFVSRLGVCLENAWLLHIMDFPELILYGNIKVKVMPAIMQRYFPALLLLVSLLFTFFVYLPGASGYFLFDDKHNIVENTSLHIQSLDFYALKQAALSGYAGILGRPVSTLSFALNYYFSGLSLNPFHLKLTNILIHLLNGLGIFVLSHLIFSALRQRDITAPDINTTRWISLAVAAAWLLHPLNLTGVLYIVQRMTSLAALFTLLGLISYIHGRLLTLKGQAGWGWIVASFILFTPLAAFSKENGALLPAFMLLTELVFFRFQSPSIATKRLLMALFGITVILPFAALLVYTVFHPAWLTGGYSTRDFTLSERLMTESRVLWFYMRWIVAPDITQLGMYHDDILVSKGLFEPVSTLFACIGLLLLGVLSILSIKRYPIVAFGILFFLIGHSMESSALALELVHEHRNYLPIYGVLLPLFYTLLYPLRHLKSLTLRRIVTVIFIMVLAGITFMRATQWGDPVVMKEKEVAHHPNSIRANIEMGSFYAAMPAASQIEAEDFYRRSYEHFVAAASASPADTLGLFGLIGLHAKRALLIEDSWVQALAGRMERYPFSPSTGNSLAGLEVCLSKGDCSISPEIMETLIQAALRNPTLQGRAKTQVLFAWSNFLLLTKQQPDAAKVAAYQAVDAYPQDIESHINLIRVLINMDKIAEAQARIAQTRKLDTMGAYRITLDELESLITKLQETPRQGG